MSCAEWISGAVRRCVPRGLANLILIVLADAGYFLVHIGKWHLGDPPTHGPEQQGFHVNVAGFRVGTPPGGYFPPYRNPYLEDGPADEYLTDRLVDEAIAQIRQHRERPFVIYLPHYAPHTPIQAKPELQKQYQDRPAGQNHHHAAYAAMVDSIDQGVGQKFPENPSLG